MRSGTDPTGHLRSRWATTVGLTLPMMLLTGLMLTGGAPAPGDRLRELSLVATWLLANILFLRMVRTGKTDRYRAIFFVTMSVCFVIGFISNLVEMRGSMALSEEDILNAKAPFCHIVIPMTLIPAAFTRTIIFPGSILGGFAPIAVMFTIWLGASLVLGRGWCSWGCFFGGLEDGISRLRSKPLISEVGPHWRYLPYAILLAVVLSSAALLSPTYCEWLCPFKTVTEYPQIDSFPRAIQAGIFLSLFIGLVVVLPLLTRRRTQCSFLCPFGAFQSVANWVNAVDIRIDPAKCRQCARCVRSCPTFSLDAMRITQGTPRSSCSRCGRCVDECPHDALGYHVKGTPPGSRPALARFLYVFPAFLFLTTFGGSMIQGGLNRLLLLLTTGKLLH
jgi:ferredoxin-type protein NapH